MNLFKHIQMKNDSEIAVTQNTSALFPMSQLIK